MSELASVPPPEGVGECERDLIEVSEAALRSILPVLAGLSFGGALLALFGIPEPVGPAAVLGALFSTLFGGLWLLYRDASLPHGASLTQVCLGLAWIQFAGWLFFAPEAMLPAFLVAAAVSVWVVGVKEFYFLGAWAFIACFAGVFSPAPVAVRAGAAFAVACLMTIAAGVRTARLRIAEAAAERVLAEREARVRTQTDSFASASQQAVAYSRVLEARGEMDGLWDWDLRSDRIYFSPRWRALLDYGDNAVTGGPADWFNLVHPYDLEELMSRLRAHLEGESDRFECEHRIRQADGSYRWVLSHGRVVFDDDGNPERLAGSQVDMKRLKNYEAQLIHQATHDRLTGLPNRERLREILHEEHVRFGDAEGRLLTVAFLDLDDFKQINDTLGHMAGDELLQQVAQRLTEAVGSEHVVARLGGDEFVIVLRGLPDEREAMAQIRSAAASLNPPFTLGSEDLSLRISVGVAVARDGDLGPDEILRNADIAMYHAKRQGKGRVELFSSEMGWKASRQFELQARLRRAFENRRFELFYQPILDAEDGRIVCAEALMRWRTGSGEIVLPGEFIPMVEEMDLIHDLGRWALEEACQQVITWREAGLPEIEVSVNVSAKQLARPDLVEAVKSTLAHTGLDPSLLQLEITESDLVESRYNAPEVLDRFALLGIKTAIDDFGTGYSSLSYLRSLRCDVLKIDRSFVSEVASDSKKSAAITRSIISLAQNLQLGVVAEGVETQPQIDFLRAAGCQRLQGYFAGRPMPARELEAVMRRGGRLPLRGPDSVSPLPPRSSGEILAVSASA